MQHLPQLALASRRDGKAAAADKILLEIGHDQALCAQDAGGPGHDDLAHVERSGHIRSVQRTGTAERHQRIVTWVVAAFDRDLAHRPHHVRDDDPQNTERGLLDAETKPVCRRA